MKNKISIYHQLSHPIVRVFLAFMMTASILLTQFSPASAAPRKAAAFRTNTRVRKLRKVKVTAHSVRLKWRKVKGASGYQIYRSVSKKGTFRKIATTRKNRLTNKKLRPNKKYFYKVRAFRSVKNKKRYGRFSSTIKVKTKRAGTGSPDTVVPSAGTPSAPASTTLPPQGSSTIRPTISPNASATGLPSASPDPSATTLSSASPDPSATAPSSASPDPSASTQSSASPDPSASAQSSASPDPSATASSSALPDPSATASSSASPDPSASVLPSESPAVITEKYVQNLNYEESTEAINNPDQGFYRPIYVRVKEDGVSYNKNIVNKNTQLYHLRVDISAFSQANNEVEDKELSEEALAGIDELLSYLYENNKSAIARFVYDPGLNGASNKEPALPMIIQHITQLSAILDKYHETLTAIEVGLIGPWGEMHTSTMANKEVINALIDAYLDHTTEIPILVRTPKMIYNYLGITINDIDTYQIGSTDKAYRLGLFNDGYLGSSSDLGTYSDREKEVPWLASQTDHLPYGGEVVIPDSTLHEIENCLDEMYLINLSYLNIEWNNNVIDKWKNTYYTDAAGNDSLYYGTTAFQYIENHMGYRFVLENSVLEYDKDLSQFGIELSLKNVGFGNLNRSFYMTLLIQSESGEVYSIDAGQLKDPDKITFQTDLDLPAGNYQVYLKLDKGNDKYALQFANDLWNAELQANLIGSFQKTDS